jgi:hypothetical protein
MSKQKVIKWLMSLQKQGYETITIAEVLGKLR